MMDREVQQRWLRWHNTQQPLIDLRSNADFVRAHVVGATSLPFHELRLRRHELPDRGGALFVCHDGDSSDAEAMLRDWGYDVLDVLPMTADDVTDLGSLVALESGARSRQLWQPNALLPRVINEIENHVATRCALDLACGSGRDSLYLAQRGWQVTAVDIQHDALQRLRLSAERASLSIDTICQNIERDTPNLARESFDLIVVVRYLHRPLLPYLAQWLKRGGYLVYQQFHVDAAAYGKPRSSAYLLRSGELNEVYRGWPTVIDEISRLDDGRPMVNFVARKNEGHSP